MREDGQACPGPEALAQWAEGSVDDDERAQLVLHAEGCDRCREAIAMLAQMRSSDDVGAHDAPAMDGEGRPPLPGPGDQLGRFRIEKVLGRGGMGVVLLAHDERLDRDVALKIALGDGAASTRLRKEAKALAALRHPNLVAVHEVGEERGQPYLVMELVRGQNLRAHVALERPPWRVTLEHCLEAARGVEALHVAGFVHRDLKPDNLMLADDGRVLVVDLGLAQRPEDRPAPESARTRTGAIVGTPRYLAPERVGGARADVASDVYALAATMLELVRSSTGTPPPRLVATLTRALDPDPEERPRSVTLLCEEVTRSVALRRGAWVAAGIVGVVTLSGALYAMRAETPIAEDAVTPGTPNSSAYAPPPSTTAAPLPSSALMPSAPSATTSKDPLAETQLTANTPATPTTPLATAGPSGPLSQPQPPASAPFISGSAAAALLSAAASGGLAQIDPRPLPPVFSREWMARMDWPPRTFDVGYAKIMEGYQPCGPKPEPESIPRGLDFGPIEKQGVVELVKPGGETHKSFVVMVKGQRGRETFVGFRDGSYLDAAVGDWVLVRSGPASKDALPAGWEAAKEVRFSEFAPIAGAPAWSLSKPKPEHLPCGPRLKPVSDDPFEKERTWGHGTGPYLFEVRTPPKTPIADGPAVIDGFILEATPSAKNVALLEKATRKMPVWVIARFSRIESRNETKLAVMKLDEVMLRLVEPPNGD